MVGRYLEQVDNRIAASSGTMPVYVKEAIKKIRSTLGKVTVNELSSMTGMSRQSITLGFKASIGVTPKYYIRMVRFHTCIAWIHGTVGKHSVVGFNWRKVAACFGFYDQAHMIREFNHFVQRPPLAYLAWREQNMEAAS